MTEQESRAQKLVEAAEFAHDQGRSVALARGTASLVNYIGAQRSVVAVLRELATDGPGVLLNAHALNGLADEIEQGW